MFRRQQIGVEVERRHGLFVDKASSCTKLTHDRIEGRRTALRAADVMFGRGGSPEAIERPPLGAMAEQASKRQAHFDGIDPVIAGARHRRAQDPERQVDDDALMTGDRCHDAQ